MLKRILIFCLAIWAFSTYTYAEENDRWIWVSSNSNYSVYIDKNTIQTVDEDDSIIYWKKAVWLNGFVSISKIKVNRAYQEYATFYTKSQSPRTYPKENYSPNPNYYPIYPDSNAEKEANIVCRLLKLPTIFGVQEHNWKWFHSSDIDNSYICTDAYQYNSRTKCFKIFYKTERLGKTYYADIDVDISGHSIYSNGRELMIVPDSFAEALYNAAKSII